VVDFELLDGYLLGEPAAKAEVIASILSRRSPLPAAAPFYRAFEAVGVRAADEAFIALRLVLAGIAPSDERVKRLRGLVKAARAGSGEARQAARRAYYVELGAGT
jgi:hypothetical protein